VDLGITGRDQVAEHECVSPPTATSGVEEVLDLDFGKCSLQVQVPAKGDLATPEDLIGKNVVTSFTNLAEQYFRRLEEEQAGETNGQANGDTKLKTVIKYVGGSVEAACALGVADGIVDLVESGETMRAAGLKAISTVVSSSAIMIKSKHPSDPKLVELISARIKGVISKLYVRLHLRSVYLTVFSCAKVCLVHIQHRPIQTRHCTQDHSWTSRSHGQRVGGRWMGGRPGYGAAKGYRHCHGQVDRGRRQRSDGDKDRELKDRRLRDRVWEGDSLSKNLSCWHVS
jgi:ATP phosphoribosyltransferase